MAARSAIRAVGGYYVPTGLMRFVVIRRFLEVGIVRPCVLLAAILLSAGAVCAANDPTAGAKKISEPIFLDGKLTEPAWNDTFVLRLTQQSPQPGESTPYLTEVRVLISDNALYFGFTCTDPQADDIAIHTMRRDGDMGGDDTVALVLDTYGDLRTGYFFQINAAGARSDGLISDPNSVSLNWDGIWDARTVRTEYGWSAEIVIPSRTLSFTRGLESWGMNFQRYVARERMYLTWSSPTLDSYLYDLSRAGQVTGVGGIEQGKGLEVVPYGLGKTNRFYGAGDRTWKGTAGGEITWKITPQFVTVFTANTDFAETEVDTPQVNLTRFALFFPEKRAFFLEGANQYTFGLGISTSEFVPFFSRRIGLLGETPIPIDGGVKLNGRLGKWNLALLDVGTRETRLPSTMLVPSANLLAGRVSYDANQHLRMGTILTHGDPEGLRQNTLAGSDVVWRTSDFRGDKNLLLGAWAVTTQGDVRPGSKVGWGANISFPNDLWNWGAQISSYGEGLEPLLGFLPRPGIRHSNFHGVYAPRPSRTGSFGWIRQENIRTKFDRYTNSKGINESRFFDLSAETEFQSGDSLSFQMQPQGETLLAPFEIAPGVVIPTGSYDYIRWGIKLVTASDRPLQASVTNWRGNFYTGRLTQWQSSLKWTSPEGRLQLQLNFDNNFGRLLQGNFVQRLWYVQATYAWNPNLLLNTFVQYNGRNVGTNTRLRWTIRPGNDLFLVWNRRWQRLLTSPDLTLEPQSDEVAIKLRWSFRY